MKPSQKCIDLITKFEGFRAEPYLCPAGKPTIGYGSTEGVSLDMPPITRELALDMLEETLEDISRSLRMHIDVPLNQNQFDALCSLVYNCGKAPLQGTLGRKLNDEDYSGAANQFDRWVYAKARKLPGLVARRAAEKALFLGEA